MESTVDQAPASDTPETELAELVEARRAELGIQPGDNESAFTSIVSRLKAMPETPHEAANRQAEATAFARRERDEVLHRGTRLVTGAGDRYRLCRLENFDVTSGTSDQASRRAKIVATLREYIGDLRTRIAGREGIVLYGPVGTGKDHLAYAVAREFVLAGEDVLWLNGQDWFGQVRDAIGAETPEASVVSGVASPAVAVISDPLPPIGPLSQHQATMLYRAIDDRYGAGKLTIITLNVDDDREADSRLGVATWDRLCHGAWKICCKWDSYRKPAREVKP